MRLSDIISVAPRYTRAINLERDASTPAALDGYVITTTAQSFIQRLVTAFRAGHGHRAWTLTGPYGSGKSAFVLFLSNLLSPALMASGKKARQMLREQHSEIYRELCNRTVLPKDGFCPILISGSSEPLLGAVLRATYQQLRAFYSLGRPSVAFRELESLRDAFAAGRPITSHDFIDVLVRNIESLRSAGKAQGILLVIDELGKFLEYAAREPERGDIFLLQQIAEATASFSEPSLLLFTVLHQAFERYASELRPGIRDEWAKVQGRFEDVAFQEPPEQILDLVAQAMHHVNNRHIKPICEQGRRQAERAADLGLVPRGMERADYIAAMEQCAPLHPLVVLALARLCRKFGQNQRSLFSFLVSREPHGFANFLLREINGEDLPCFRLPELYDYVIEAFGSGIAVGEGASRWAEVQAALERSTALSETEQRLIKTIGLLSAIGVYGEFKPSPAVLEFAEDLSTKITQRAIRSLLDRSILIERKHSNTLALWEGSDIDLDARLVEAVRQLPLGGSLAQKANLLWRPRPLVAKRHSYETGTLRYFDIVFVDITTFSRALEGTRESDGVLLYALPGNRAEREELLALARSSKVRERLEAIVAVPEEVEGFQESVRELELLRWIQANTPELQGDAVARRELRSRIAVVESRVATEVRRLFSPDEQLAKRTLWFHHGLEQEINQGRTLSEFISAICDSIYEHTPKVRNELLNRRSLSSAAAAARRLLIDAMITKAGEPRLGITGTPPELSMYASVLENTGIHRLEGSLYAFGAPKGDRGLQAVWERIERFFNECELERHSVQDLFTALQKPPFGIKLGLIPVLFCAAVMAHDSDVALYENGAFIPELAGEVFDRLLRSPEKFELRQYRVEGVRREVFFQLAQIFGSSSSADLNLVSVVRPLFKFFNRLPGYSRQTKSISAMAISVRDALLGSKEPDRLLFDELPRACGFAPFPPGEGDPDALRLFMQAFRESVLELQRAYDDLLMELRRLVARAFDVPAGGERAELRERASAVLDACIEGRLKAFASLLSDHQANDTTWIESIATMLVGKVPKSWNDVDRARYEVALAEMARSFRHMEALVFEETRRRTSGRMPEHLFRVGISDRHSKDYERVVGVDARDRDRLAETILDLRAALAQAGVLTQPDLALSALAMVCREILSTLEPGAKASETAKTEQEVNSV